MNKLHLLILGGLATLASCASEDVINSGDINAPSSEGQAMTFGMLTGNHSRATDAMVAAGHTDFGVFAYKGIDMATGKVMDNYCVKYSATGDDDGSNTTWGNASNLEDGLSKWYYEGVASHKQDGTPQTQVLKYWDQSFTNHYFVAYTPYNNANTSRTLLEANAIASTDLKSNLHILGANSFWTMDERGRKEAMWAVSNVAKANYDKDVALTFKHLNAKIQLAFRSNIPGYTVKLINLVPATNLVTLAPAITEVKYGVQLTPATKAQAEMGVTSTISWDKNAGAAKPALTQKYATTVNFNIADVFAATPDITTTDITDSSKNLIFHLSETAGDAAQRLLINEGASATYTPLGSHYFALPLSDYTGIHETGYTLHVSYVLIPNDGAAETIVYDARVFIPADNCKWAYGKSYTYNFTITKNSNGVTDPNTPIYTGSGDVTGIPYVDPTDPRVPSRGALVPIVFDGVTVNDYEVVSQENININ
ncbi:MAG: fimbrillin family protein [Muribaculaceae bacterium]